MLVSPLDQQPALLLPGSKPALTWLEQYKCAMKLPAVKDCFDFTLSKLLLWRCVTLRFIGSSVPHHHRARPILTFRNDALKICVLDRMILGPYGHSLIGRVKRWPLGYGPGCEDSVYLQPKVVVQSTSIMLLDHKDAIASRPTADAPRRFRCLAEPPLLSVFFE